MLKPSEKQARIEVKNNSKKTKIIKKIEKAKRSKAKVKSRKWINLKKERQRKQGKSVKNYSKFSGRQRSGKFK
jgi:18S rRNA (guanine1575-N7)-methyltransferase